MSYSYESDQSFYGPDWVCSSCHHDVDSYCQGYMDVSGEKICAECLAINAGLGAIDISRNGEVVTFTIYFPDDTFTYVANAQNIFFGAVVSLGYTPIPSTDDLVMVKYEDPIIRKLCGRKDIGLVAKLVGDEVADILS